MAKVFNKSSMADKFKQGRTGKASERMSWYNYKPVFVLPKDPLEFANSNELSKIKRKK